MYDAIIIGGGAAGIFGAVQLAERKPDARILVLEKTGKLLAKVKVSGGGRCNVTHACFDNKILSSFYPRGNKELLGAFHQFNTQDTIDWFESRGVRLKAEKDGRMFPTTDNSQTIIDCLMDAARENQIEIITHCGVQQIRETQTGFDIVTDDNEKLNTSFVLLASGGHAKDEHFSYLRDLNHSIVSPVPSLFTFNLPKSPICKLQGISVSDCIVSLPEHKESFRGPVLITHWGLSGPAVLKLSAFAARKLHAANYEYKIKVQWLPDLSENEIFETLKTLKNGGTGVQKRPYESIPSRLWDFFLGLSEIEKEAKWAECSDKKLKKMSYFLHASLFDAMGKTTFKEEFVTCGGINRKEIDFRTMQSKLHKGLHFAGEIIDIDGITGGFNFQAAWTTATISAKSIAENLDKVDE